jgi:hypothetical protein
MVHDRSFSMRKNEIPEGLVQKEHLEQDQKLGELLGFEAGKIEGDAAPIRGGRFGRPT